MSRGLHLNLTQETPFSVCIIVVHFYEIQLKHKTKGSISATTNGSVSSVSDSISVADPGFPVGGAWTS